jgi:Carboxypeptidase regulatory-like domain
MKFTPVAKCSGLLFVLVLGVGSESLAQTPSGTIDGQVTDPSGAAISGASITVTGTSTATRTSTTDMQGRYRIDGLIPAPYIVHLVYPGFAPFDSTRIDVMAGRIQTINIRLGIQTERSNITVSDAASQISVDPSQSAGQFVLKGSDLDAFSDDPEDLANELQMLAGPAQGPNGGQIFIDGFSDGIIPPKASIREIRVNQNPFSAEFDRVGFGRVEIFTKPGSDKFHGQISFDFGDRALTARNPYLVGPIVPNYQQEIFAGNFGGPLSKKASFFVDVNRRITDENSLLNYTYLTAALNPATFNGAVIAPSHRTSISPRLDYALTPNNTLTLRYSWVDTNATNQGINVQTFDQASQAYSQSTKQQSVQLIDSAVIGTSWINDVRFQFLRTHADQMGTSSAPEVDVEGAFTGGGTFPLNYTSENKSEFQENVAVVHGTHTIKFGGRLRDDRLTQQSTSNFNGRFIFSATPGGDSAIEVYQQDQLLAAQGLPQAQIAAMGFGPSEFLLTAGNPVGRVGVFDAGVYIQDDWRAKPNLLISGGLRYEGQSAISDHADFAPRIGLAWAPGGRSGRTPKTVVRAGGGMFYDRFPSNLLMNATLLNGINQTQYIIRDPSFFPVVPDVVTLAALSAQQGGIDTHATYQVDPALRAPYMIQGAAAIERQLPHGASISVNYTETRGVHELLTRDINAPLPPAFDSQGEAIGPRPFGTAAGDIYQYEAAGVFRQNQLIVTMNGKINSRLSLFGYYVYGHASSDTDGPGTMPSNPYDLRQDYGRAAFDNRHRAFISANATLPFKIRMAPFLFMQTGVPYNVTSGVDTNGDGNPNDDRPAFATDLSRPSVIKTPFGAFDIDPATLPNAVIIPRNYLQAPGILSANVRLSRSWSFGERGGGNTGGNGEIAGGGAIQNGGLSGGSSQSGMAGVFGGVKTAKRLNLTLTASFRNVLNNVNPAIPIGNLSSPFFGKSVTLNTFGPLPGAGPNAGAGNRHIELQLRLTF